MRLFRVESRESRQMRNIAVEWSAGSAGWQRRLERNGPENKRTTHQNFSKIMILALWKFTYLHDVSRYANDVIF
jgi:hypothetical protein